MSLIKNQWNLHHLKQCEKRLGQAMLSDEHSLAVFSEDFGKLIHSKPAAIFEPSGTEALRLIMQYAHENELSVTVRGHGVSQNGQSLAVPGGLILHMKHFNAVQEPDPNGIWIEANATWASLLEHSLKHSLVPYVIPHNCNLSIGGVLSAGGIGGTSFKYGSATAQVNSLEVVQANGTLAQVNEHSSLMQACLGGQGHFGLITKAHIPLRSCLKSVRTFFLTYLDKKSWLDDLARCQKKADYIESFCCPAIQGAKLSEKGRLPFAQWLYSIHVSLEYDDTPPEFTDLGLSPWKLLHTQEEPIHSYLHRHDSRFTAMKMSGQWELAHPWYECFVSKAQLEHLDDILAMLPIHYASVVHVAPIASGFSTGFLMLPEAEEIFAVMILNPGLPQALIPSCLDAITNLDKIFLAQGGKRYLSGFLGKTDGQYWQKHFGKKYPDWVHLKEQYDPLNIFCSIMHQ